MSKHLNFDSLYATICSNSDHHFESILRDLCKATTDFDRVQLCLTHPSLNIVELFLPNIVESYKSNDIAQAGNLYGKEIQKVQQSIQTINLALSLSYVKTSETSSIFDLSCLANQKNVEGILRLEGTTIHEDTLISKLFYSRATLFLQAENYEGCIRDALRALMHGFPKSYDIVFLLAQSYQGVGHCDKAMTLARHSLDLLKLAPIGNEGKCKEAVKVTTFMKNSMRLAPEVRDRRMTEDSFSVVGGPHPSVSSMSAFLELKYDLEHGRQLVANQDIPAGSILIIEEPFVWTLDPECYTRFCQNCARSLVLGEIIPCSTCSSVVFCSEECAEEGWSSFHKWECRIMTLLDSSVKLGKMALLGFRTVTKVNLETLVEKHKAMMEQKTEDRTLMLMGYNVEGKVDSSDYTSVFAQVPNSDGRNGADLLKRTLASIYLTLCLRYQGYFQDMGQSETKDLSGVETIVASLFLRHLQSVSCNAYSINRVLTSDPRMRGIKVKEVGGATYPVISTTNHSCFPNIYRFTIGKKCVVGSLIDIRKGEELFDSYGPLVTTTPRDARRQELKTQYCFTCLCPACTNDWPGYANTPPLPTGHDNKKLLKLFKQAGTKFLAAKERLLKGGLFEGSNNQGKEEEDTLKSISKYIEVSHKLSPSTPSKQLIEAQELLKLFWNMKANQIEQ